MKPRQKFGKKSNKPVSSSLNEAIAEQTSAAPDFSEIASRVFGFEAAREIEWLLDNSGKRRQIQVQIIDKQVETKPDLFVNRLITTSLSKPIIDKWLATCITQLQDRERALLFLKRTVDEGFREPSTSIKLFYVQFGDMAEGVLSEPVVLPPFPNSTTAESLRADFIDWLKIKYPMPRYYDNIRVEIARRKLSIKEICKRGTKHETVWRLVFSTIYPLWPYLTEEERSAYISRAKSTLSRYERRAPPQKKKRIHSSQSALKADKKRRVRKSSN